MWIYSFILDIYLSVELLGYILIFIVLYKQCPKSTKFRKGAICNLLNDFKNWNLDKVHSKQIGKLSNPSISHRFFPKQRENCTDIKIMFIIFLLFNFNEDSHYKYHIFIENILITTQRNSQYYIFQAISFFSIW